MDGKRPKCEKCDSRSTYTTLKEIVCKACGHRKKRGKDEEK